MKDAEQGAGPRKRREQQRAVDTKLNIVEAALAEFADKGFEAASMRTIAERTGLQHQLIGYHFHSKQALWQAVATHIFATLDQLRSLRIVDDESRTALQRLRLEYLEFYQTTIEYPVFHHFMLRENSPGNPRLEWITENYLKPYFARVAPLIKAAQKTGELPPCEPILIHYMIVAMVTTLTGMGGDIKAISGVDPADPKTVDTFWSLIDTVLLKHGASSLKPTA